VARRRRKQQPVKKSLWRRLNDSEMFSKKKPKKTEVVSFTRELTTLLESGIGMGPALLMLGGQRKTSMLGEAVLQLAEDLNSGSTIAEAMGKHPQVFPRIYVRTVSAADRGAPLAPSLKQAADFMDTAASAISQAKRSLIYPALVLMVGFGVVVMLLTVSLPQMIGLFENLGTQLPLPTRILIAMSDFLRSYPLVILGFMVAMVAGFLKFKSTERGKLAMHRMMLKTPLLKGVVISSDLARASGALSSLTQVGMPVPDAMDVARDTVGNEIIRRALTEARQGLIAGEGLAGPLDKAGLFPPTFIQTLRVAEDTGTLDANLKRMTEFYQKDAQDKVKAMVSLIEPLSTVVVALLVGFVALSVIMPMYSALGAFDK
jgi:type IV pilus assembly protein PilC